jgi:hypothetical protein
MRLWQIGLQLWEKANRFVKGDENDVSESAYMKKLVQCILQLLFEINPFTFQFSY